MRVVDVLLGVLGAVHLGRNGEGWCFKRGRTVATSSRGDCSGVAVRTSPLIWMVMASPEPSTNSHCGFHRAAAAACGSKLFYVHQLRVQLSVGGLEGGVEGCKCAGIL